MSSKTIGLGGVWRVCNAVLFTGGGAVAVVVLADGRLRRCDVAQDTPVTNK